MEPFVENFVDTPDGPCLATPRLTNFPAHPAAGAPYNSGGWMTFSQPNVAVGGCYRVYEACEDVTRIGARFALTHPGADGGLLALSIQQRDITTTSPQVPVSPMHFWLDHDSWNLDVNDTHGTQVDFIASGAFVRPLRTDGRTLHDVEVHLDRAARECRMDLPDGTSIVVTHPLLALPGRFAYVEPFKTGGTNQSQKATALVRKWWVGTE